MARIYRHRKRGGYYLKLFEANEQTNDAAHNGLPTYVYVSINPMNWLSELPVVFARSADEFEDGRFEEVW